MPTLRFKSIQLLLILSTFISSVYGQKLRNESSPQRIFRSSIPCEKSPKIQCPANITLCPGSDIDPTGTGRAKGIAGGPNCELPIIEYVDRITSEGPCLGEKIIQRLWTATDPQDPNLRAFCIQYITLEDKTPPTFLSCIRDTTVLSNNQCFAMVTWQTPYVSDLCSNCCLKSSHANGTIFPVGTTEVIFTVTDDCGNANTCAFHVTVMDNCCSLPPIIHCPADYAGCVISANPSITGIARADSSSIWCSAPIITYLDDTTVHSPCSLFINRTWTATDPNNPNLKSSCVQKIELADHEKPTINCPANITIKADADCMATVSWTEPTATDNCNQVSLSSTHASGSKFIAGVTTVVYTATDACGNATQCQFTITVEGNCCDKPPVVLCPSDFEGCPQGIDPSVTGKGSALKANKFCTTPLLRYSDDTVLQQLCQLKVVRTWMATDTFTGMSSSCQQKINLNDILTPFILIPADITVASAADCMASVQWNLPATSDNCSSVNLSSTHQSGDRFPIGVHTVTYTATDACGNTSTKSFTITVEDHCCDIAPTIQCPPKYISCPGSSIEPEVSGKPLVNPGSNLCRPPKISYTDHVIFSSPCSLKMERTWLAVDSFKNNLKAECIQEIELKDTIKPILECPSNIVLPSNENCIAIAEWKIKTSDDCSAVTISSSHESGAEFKIGTRTIFYTVLDACGNSTGCQFDVTVTDNCCNEAPHVECPPDFFGCPQGVDPSVSGQAKIISSGQCGTPILYYRDDTLNFSACSLTINRIWIGVDSAQSNLRDSCIQRIQLSDTLSPYLKCPSNIHILSDQNCKARVVWNDPAYTDNCSTVKLIGSAQSGDVFQLGTTVVEYTATDLCGNQSSCSFEIVVEENCCIKNPRIICPGDITDCPGSIDPLRLGTPTVLKGNPSCSEPQLTFLDEFISNKACSTIIDRKWLAVDPNNTSLRDSCIQHIKLIDEAGPVFKACPVDITVTPNYNCEAFPTWTEPTAEDLCRLVSVTRSHGPGSRFLPGQTIVSYTAMDACGNVSICSFTVTVTDDCCSKPPSISCPVNYKACPSSSILPEITGRAMTDAGSVYCAKPLLSYTDNILSTGPCPGAMLLERNWLAIDPNLPKLSASCKQRIELSDVEKPVIHNLPKDLHIDAKGQCETEVHWLEPDASDNCLLKSLQSNIANGSKFKGGTTTVVYTATDGCGNSSTASFKVIISGTEIQLECPRDTVVYRTNPAQNGVIVHWEIPKAKYCSKCQDSIQGFIYMGEFAGNRYFCSQSPARWEDAKISCILNGGKLAVIHNQEENQFISSKLMGQIAWIGASDERREGFFEWVDGSPFIYNNWIPGRPSISNPSDDYVELHPNGFWNDQNGNTSREYICQIPCYSLKQIAGPPTGSNILCGTTRISYEASKDGVRDTCNFNITVDCDSVSKYCYNRALNTDVMWIDHVSLENIDNTSGDNYGYAYFDKPCATLKNNVSYTLCVDPGFKAGKYIVYWKVWIDFNNDGNFQNTELILIGNGDSGLCGKFQIPPSYVTGRVRMRVIMSYGNYVANACSSIIYGEVEDYCIELKKNGTVYLQDYELLLPQELKCVYNCPEKSMDNQIDSRISLQGNYSVELIPNPAKDKLHIFSNSKEISSYNIFDLNGKLVWRKFAPVTHQETVDVGQWAEGLYYLMVEYQNSNQLTHKIIIQH